MDLSNKYLDGREFFAVLRGMQLRDIPNIPVVVRPLIRTSTHDLALETDPVWSLRIKHNGTGSGIKTRPKVSLYTDARRPVLTFRLRAQPLWTSLDDFYQALKDADFTLSPHPVVVTVRKPPAVLQGEPRSITEILQRHNDTLARELRGRRPSVPRIASLAPLSA